MKKKILWLTQKKMMQRALESVSLLWMFKNFVSAKMEYLLSAQGKVRIRTFGFFSK